MRNLFVGFDEAGYGPLLGPLCVATYATSNLDDMPCEDSKQVHRRGKLEPLIQRCAVLLTKGEILERVLDLNAGHESIEPWFNQVRFTNDESEGLRDAQAEVRTKAINPLAYNRKIDKTQNKAEVLAQLYEDLILKLKPLLLGQDRLVFDFDRMGGRKDYLPLLEKWGFEVKPVQISTKMSRYEGIYTGIPVQVSFLVKGDEKCPHIAAASCFAKMTREIYMEHFNHWWRSKIQGLKPTAGYYTDGMRFLKEIENYCLNHNVDIEALRRKK